MRTLLLLSTICTLTLIDSLFVHAFVEPRTSAECVSLEIKSLYLPGFSDNTNTTSLKPNAQHFITKPPCQKHTS